MFLHFEYRMLTGLPCSDRELRKSLLFDLIGSEYIQVPNTFLCDQYDP